MDPVSGHIFNSPLEAGLRSLFLLAAAGRRAFDVQRLVYLDYALVHSADLGGPPSIHPIAPGQRGELLVRRELLQEGLALMRSRELVEQRFQRTGIVFAATRVGRHVAKEFESTYAADLRDRAAWVVGQFGALSDTALRQRLRPLAGAGEGELIETTRRDWSTALDG